MRIDSCRREWTMRMMSRVIAFSFFGLVLCLPVLGADDKNKKEDAAKKDADKTDVKKDDAAKKDAEKMPKMPAPKDAKFKNLERDPAAAAEKMMKSTKVTARVMAVVEEKKSVRLQLTIPYLKINVGEVQNYNNAYMNMLRASNPQQLLQAQQSMANHQARIYQIATTQKEVEWTATEDAKVRMKNPPPQFDEKGRVKRYTAKELKELRGNDKIGYPAEFSDLKSGQIVEVTLVQKKDAPRPRRGKDADLLGENMPNMSVILILAEPRQ